MLRISRLSSPGLTGRHSKPGRSDRARPRDRGYWVARLKGATPTERFPELVCGSPVLVGKRWGRRWSRVAACVALVLVAITLSFSALAVQPDEILPDPALEQRARALSKELRCMVCQNQSIDDSDAPLAKDLRVLVRERLTAGDTDNQVIDYLVSRYGEFVLLKPRIAAHTAILWGAPLAVLLIGAVVVFVTVRRRRAPDALSAPAALTPEEERRLNRLIEP
jgi:cytochrome c-type biogenesis protein CcmH